MTCSWDQYNTRTRILILDVGYTEEDIPFDMLTMAENIFAKTKDGDYLCIKSRHGHFTHKRRYAKVALLQQMDTMI
jgi:hypothetical protein